MKAIYLVSAALAAVLLLTAAWLVSRPPTPRPAQVSDAWFSDVTEDVGLDFVHDPGETVKSNYFMPGIIGSGAALLDFNNDGRMDILLIQNGGPGSTSTNRLFRQEADGR